MMHSYVITAMFWTVLFLSFLFLSVSHISPIRSDPVWVTESEIKFINNNRIHRETHTKNTILKTWKKTLNRNLSIFFSLMVFWSIKMFYYNLLDTSDYCFVFARFKSEWPLGNLNNFQFRCSFFSYFNPELTRGRTEKDNWNLFDSMRSDVIWTV